MAKKVKIPDSVKVDLPTGQVAQEKKERTFEIVQQEFGSLCARAGHLQYQVYTFNKDLEILNGQIRDLNFEAAAMKAKQTGTKGA